MSLSQTRQTDRVTDRQTDRQTDRVTAQYYKKLTLVEMDAATPSLGENGVDRKDCLPTIQDIELSYIE